jgi:hypothetical protein
VKYPIIFLSNLVTFIFFAFIFKALHYATAYGTSEEALYVLADAYHDALTTMDCRGRTPLHFALSNAGRKSAPAAVRLLLNLNKDIVNSAHGGPLPLRVLAEFATTVQKDAEDQRESAQRCLEYLLAAEPKPTAGFFAALQSLPAFLQERAVVLPGVQLLFNDKIAQRFPTLILMLDFYVQVMVIVVYSVTVDRSIDMRFTDDDDSSGTIESRWLIPLFVGASYFLLREVIQVLSLISLGSFYIWVYDPINWLSVVYIGIVYYWTIQMTLGNGEADSFRAGAALSVSVLWLKLLAYLRNMLIDFAVFSASIFYVVQRLAAFLLSLIIILVAFSRMLFTIHRQSEYCRNQVQISDEEFIADLQCDDNQVRPFCSNWDSFLSVYTMLLGEVNEDQFADSAMATGIFVVFMFLVVILLANVLIAIVTDSYKVIQKERAAIVFWTNRLDFIAQMDAIANGPWKSRLRQNMRIQNEFRIVPGDASFGKEYWKKLMELFEDDIDDNFVSLEYLCCTILRCAATFAILSWIILGLCSAGFFWPPQIREYMFTSAVFKHTTETEKEDELRRTQIKKLMQEVKELRFDLLQELAVDRAPVVQMKSSVAGHKLEIQSEMIHIKRIVAVLFEQISSA